VKPARPSSPPCHLCMARCNFNRRSLSLLRMSLRVSQRVLHLSSRVCKAFPWQLLALSLLILYIKNCQPNSPGKAANETKKRVEKASSKYQSTLLQGGQTTQSPLAKRHRATWASCQASQVSKRAFVPVKVGQLSTARALEPRFRSLITRSKVAIVLPHESSRVVRNEDTGRTRSTQS
jgi:hypothetical protein